MNKSRFHLCIHGSNIFFAYVMYQNSRFKAASRQGLCGFCKIHPLWISCQDHWIVGKSSRNPHGSWSHWTYGAFHSHGGSPIWMVEKRENPIYTWTMILGYPYDSGNHHIYIFELVSYVTMVSLRCFYAQIQWIRRITKNALHAPAKISPARTHCVLGKSGVGSLRAETRHQGFSHTFFFGHPFPQFVCWESFCPLSGLDIQGLIGVLSM